METKKIAAIVACGVLAIGAGVGISLVSDDSAKVADLQATIKALNVTAEPVIEYVDNEVVVVKNVTVEKIVEVDNGNLDLVLNTIYDAEDGDVSYLTDSLDDDELDLIVDRIVFENDAKSLAEAEVKAKIVGYIDDEADIFGEGDLVDYRDNDVYSVSVDSDDSVFEVSDYDDEEATIYVEAKLKLNNDDDRTSVRVIAEVEIEGDRVEIVDVVLKE